MSERHGGWQPEPRPGWVDRLNRAGSLLGPLDHIVPLDEASLLDAARAQTGLEDFGPDEWREPFGILLADIAAHSHLTLVGRILARFDLVHLRADGRGSPVAGQTYRFHRRIFQHLQFRAPGRWLWKGPAHLSLLPALFDEYRHLHRGGSSGSDRGAQARGGPPLPPLTHPLRSASPRA